jgi:hypothetical protein
MWYTYVTKIQIIKVRFFLSIGIETRGAIIQSKIGLIF